MSLSWRPNGISFTLRLFALVLVPLTGLGILTVQRVENESATAASARVLAENARLQQSVAAVYGPSQLEQVALEGLSTIDELNVPREAVTSVVGVDFEAYYEPNIAVLDRTLRELAEDHGDVAIGQNSNLAREITFFEASLDAQRRLFDEGRLRKDDVRALFTELDDLLEQALESASSYDTVTRASATSIEDRARLQALGDVLDASGDRGAAILDDLLLSFTTPGTAITPASNRLEFMLEEFRSLLESDDLAEFDRLRSDLVSPSDVLQQSDFDATEPKALDIDYIQDATALFLDQLDFGNDLEAYSAAFHSETVAELDVDAERAERVADNTRFLALGVAVASLSILFLIAWSTLRPLRRLTRRASDIGNGSFDLEPLPERGPKDVRLLTGTMNSMASTLRAVDHEIAGLASGETTDGDRSLPGEIGISISRSFDRLEEMTSRLHASEQLASSIVEQAADAIWTVDEFGLITSANSASVELVGVSADDQIGTPLKLHLSADDGEVAVRNASDEIVRLHVASSELTGGDRPLTTVIARDITERLRFEERLAYQAHHDGLTGLPNRFAVLEALAAEPDGHALAVLFVDLDGFKSVNDTKGHLVGDRVLTVVGQRLSDNVRPGDFVGRLGGDEFVVIMRNVVQAVDAVSFGHRLIQEIEQPYQDSENLFTLSASVGIASFPDGLGPGEVTPLDAIQRADSAVYAAKRRGRGRVEAFDERLQAEIVNDAELEIALRQAVRNDELELHLQPVLDTVLGRYTAAEALVRWNRPGHGLVPPNDFISVAERSSLIDEIGRWVITKSCETLARWSDDEDLRHMRIAVNIAGSHLLDGDLVADLDAAVVLTGADPRHLEFELTETQLMDDHERAASILEAIRARGITVAIDDFGTGYSSMAYLRQLPVDTLKIDRSFVAPIGTDDDTTVVDALLTIGHALGLSVVAEGIETEEQLAYVSSHGADRAQGFFMSRPMPIVDVESFFHENDAQRTSAG